MTWTNPTNVATGTNLTSSLWNDQLGGSGSLQYLYQRSRVTFGVSKSTTTALTAATSYTFVWDQIDPHAVDMQQNFVTPTFPTANIRLPYEGAYIATLFFRYSVVANVTVIFTVTNLNTSSVVNFATMVPTLAAGTTAAVAQIYVPVDGENRLNVAVTPSANGNSTIVTAGPSQALYIAKAGW